VHAKAAAILILVALSVPAFRRARAETPRAPVVAVFEIEDATKRPKRLVVSLTDYLRVKLAEGRAVKVVDKGDQEAQLKKLIRSEKKNSYKSCMDQSCQVPLGKELAADKILRGKLTRFGKSYVIAVEMIDLASGASAGAASEKSDGTEEQLMASVEKLAQTITASVLPPKPVEEPVQETAVKEPEKPKADPQAQNTALAANGQQNAAVTTVGTHMESPGPTGSQWVMIIGGWSVFAGAYLTEIIANLLTSDFSRSYYSVFPVVGPVLVEQINKSTVTLDAMNNPIPYKTNVLNYVDAGIQLAGGLVAVLGHILAASNPQVAVPNQGAPGAVSFIALPRYVGVTARF
jgi:hypothetical protein